MTLQHLKLLVSNYTADVEESAWRRKQNFITAMPQISMTFQNPRVEPPIQRIHLEYMQCLNTTTEQPVFPAFVIYIENLTLVDISYVIY